MLCGFPWYGLRPRFQRNFGFITVEAEIFQAAVVLRRQNDRLNAFIFADILQIQIMYSQVSNLAKQDLDSSILVLVAGRFDVERSHYPGKARPDAKDYC